jgi:hypothetical protein
MKESHGQMPFKLNWLLMLPLSSGISLAATMYVSNQGLDNAAGTEAAPLKTVAAAITKAGSGGTVLLKRGEIFREEITVNGAITLKAWGDAAMPRPVISGSAPITGWSKHSGSIYVAAVPHIVEYLYVNNEIMLIARYPNRGSFKTRGYTVENGGNTNVVGVPNLIANPRNADGYWVGANMRWRRWNWWYDTKKADQYTANPGFLRVQGPSHQGGQPKLDNTGYYMDNKFEELDTAGEWFMD